MTVSWQVVLAASLGLGLCLGVSGCQGELKLTGTVAAPVVDMAMSTSSIPPTIGYADINADIDTPPGLGCTNQIGACHGGATPSGMMALLDQAAGDMTRLMSNYGQVKQRVNTSDPPNSLILLKLLSTGQGGTAHTGGNTYFLDKNNPMYRRWLVWIQLGAPFDPVSTTGGATVDMAGGG